MSLKNDIIEDMKAHGYSKTSIFHVIKAWISHPSIFLLINYRLAQKIKFAPFKRFFWLLNTSNTGCHISLKTIIEPGVIFPHATGIVIGNGAHIKKGAKIFQNVTLAVNDDAEDKSAIIEKNTTIYAGAVLIGSLTIGKNSQVGANAVVKQNVPANKIAVGVPAIIKS
jgi:serine O-acetyltransferase